MSDCAFEKHDTSNGCSSVTSPVTSPSCGDNKTPEKNTAIEDAALLNGGSPQKRKNGLIAKAVCHGSGEATQEDSHAASPSAADNLLQPKDEPEDCATPNNHVGINGSADTKGFDDSCFKTPTLPARKASNGKKRPSGLVRVNGVADSAHSTDSNGEKDSITTGLRSVKLEGEPSCSKTPCSCPFSEEYIATSFPNLPAKSRQDAEADFVKELIIDGFSLLMFKAAGDYKVLSEREQERKAAEQAEAKRRQYFEDVRTGKVKKKGRKPKRELDSEKNGDDHDDPEERRRRKEEKRRERLERKARAENETPEERERRREDKRRLKRERKMVAENGQDAPSSNAAACLVALSNGERRDVVKLENNENQPMALGSPVSVGIKRPGSVMGPTGSPAVAPSPKLQRISSSNDLDRNSKPSTPKSEPGISSPFGFPIGIHRPNMPLLPHANQDLRSMAQTPGASANPLAAIANSYARSTSVIGKAGKPMANGTTTPNPLLDINAVFANTPDFAAFFRTGVAALHNVDPSLVSQTQLLNAAALSARPFPQLDTQQQAAALLGASSSANSVNGAHVFGASPSNALANGQKLPLAGNTSATPSASNPLALQFPAEAALASKLAGAAIFGKEPPGTSAAAPTKKSHWCDMHVTIAQSIARQRSSAASRAAASNNQPQSAVGLNPAASAAQSWVAGLPFGLPGASTSRQTLAGDDAKRISSPTKKTSVASSTAGMPYASLNTPSSNTSQPSLNALHQSLYAQAQAQLAASVSASGASTASQLQLANQLFGALSQPVTTQTASAAMTARSAQNPYALAQSSAQRALDPTSLLTAANQAQHATIQSAAAAALHPALGLFGGAPQVPHLAAQLGLAANPLLAGASGGSLTNGMSGSALQAQQQQQQQVLMMLSQLTGAGAQAAAVNPLASVNSAIASGHLPQQQSGQSGNRQQAPESSAASAMDLFRHPFDTSNSALANRTPTNASMAGSAAGMQSGLGAALEQEMRMRQLLAGQLPAAGAVPSSRAADPLAGAANALDMSMLLELNRQQQILARAGLSGAVQAPSATNAAALFNNQAAAQMMGMNALMSNPLAAAHLYGANTAKLPLSSSTAKRDGNDSFVNGR